MQENISLGLLIDRGFALKKKDEEILETLEFVYGPGIFTLDVITDRRTVISGYIETLENLKKIPVLVQRTPEWHAARDSLITASDFAQALGLGKFGTQKELIVKKCGYEEQGGFNASCPPLKWGTMLEPVANMVYERRNHVKLWEFGLLRHPTISHFGASPDGVSEHGIMVEIKCPYKRKIDGTVPLQYYYQIQGQLEVCGLEECDYFESEFTLVDFDQLVNYKYERGAIIEDHGMVYKYSPVYGPLDDCWEESLNNWINSEKVDGSIIHVYALEKTNTIRVYKDSGFLDEHLNEVGEVWAKIKEYREDKGLYDREIGAAKEAKTMRKTNVSTVAKSSVAIGAVGAASTSFSSPLAGFSGFKLKGYAFE